MMKSGTARAIAKLAHRGQLDKGGEDYMEHVERVARAVVVTEYERTGEHNDELYAVALLHDVVEDTPMTHSELLQRGLSLAQYNALVAITRRGINNPEYSETYAEYIDRVILNPMARKIKAADLYDNMNPARVMASGTVSLLHRYAGAFTRIMAAERDVAATTGDDVAARC